MTAPRSADQEARDPATAPDRLLELTRTHPELQSLIVVNPSCPRVARDWILATNPEAERQYRQARRSVAPPAPSTQGPAEADPDGVDVWGDLLESPPAPTPVGRTPSVQVAEDGGVVPLGAAGASAHPTPGPAPAAAPTAAPPPPPRSPQSSARDRRGPWLLGAGCLLLALLLVVAAVVLGRLLLGEDEDAYQRPSSDPAAEQTQEAEPEEETAPEQDPVSPAPEGALELDEVRSPTGNITCSLEGDAVGCSVADRDFSEGGLEDCDQGPYSIQVADGEAATACGQSFGSPSAPQLEYDTSAVSGHTACTSAFDGMTCWNTQTGKGFFVNRVTYETF